jgi:hypothetical protein
VLILRITTGLAQSAKAGSSERKEPVAMHAHREERHEVEGLPRQPLLKRPASEPGKPLRAMTSHAHAPATAWQARSPATNLMQHRAICAMAAHPTQRSISANHARIPSGAMLARAQRHAFRHAN